jgi:hypothetical protein
LRGGVKVCDAGKKGINSKMMVMINREIDTSVKVLEQAV